jgi:hypothetical protein
VPSKQTKAWPANDKAFDWWWRTVVEFPRTSYQQTSKWATTNWQKKRLGVVKHTRFWPLERDREKSRHHDFVLQNEKTNQSIKSLAKDK